MIKYLYLLFFFFVFLYFNFISAPDDFKAGTQVRILGGMTLTETAELLKDNSVIRSPLALKLTNMIFSGGKVIAGSYVFDAPRSVFGISKMISTAGYGLKMVKVTIPEGATNKEIALLFSGKLDDFDADKFFDISKDREGYLFPDTYILDPMSAPEDVYKEMRKNFDKKIFPIKFDIAVSGRSLEEMIIMASILEEEARTEETRKMIADILWRRLDDNYPLQVDAPFVYAIGKGSFKLTLDDLKMDSPYNTYRYKGLPPTPISNPGLSSIMDALHPSKNKFWFYLSDKEGNMHYAVDFEGHKINKERYLR